MHRIIFGAIVPFVLMSNAAFAGDRLVRIQAVHSGKCLDVSGASKEATAEVIQFGCHSGDNQKWIIRDVPGGVNDIINRHSGMCMDVEGASLNPETRILQFPCQQHGNQRFLINNVNNVPGEVKIKNLNSSLCLDVQGGSLLDSVRLTQFPCLNPNRNQRFHFIPPQ